MGFYKVEPVGMSRETNVVTHRWEKNKSVLLKLLSFKTHQNSLQRHTTNDVAGEKQSELTSSQVLIFLPVFLDSFIDSPATTRLLPKIRLYPVMSSYSLGR